MLLGCAPTGGVAFQISVVGLKHKIARAFAPTPPIVRTGSRAMATKFFVMTCRGFKSLLRTIPQHVLERTAPSMSVRT